MISWATASGIALLIIFAYVVKRVTKIEFKSSMFRSLSTLLATVIIIDLFLLLVEMVTIFWATSAKTGHVIRMSEFITGRLAWSLWPLFILGITAFVLLARRKTRHLPAVQLTASVMYVVAIFFKRYALMAMGFSVNTIGQSTEIYFPSAVEAALALAILAFGLLVVTLAVKVLPMEVPDDEHDEAFYAEHAKDAAPASGMSGAEPALESGGSST